MVKERSTLERYIFILEALAPVPTGMTLNEIIERTKLPRGTAHRLINSLTRVGLLVTHAGRNKTYALGPRLMRLLYSGLSPDLVTALARPLLENLADRFGETALLARLKGNQIEKLGAWVPGDGTFSYVQPGRIMPINAAASAKAIFAFQGDEVIEEALSSHRLVRYTPSTKTSKTAIRAELAQVRRNGYAVCSDEFDPGVLSFACPVHLTDFGTIYSIGVVGLSDRLRSFQPEVIVAALRERCDALSLALYSRVKGEDRPIGDFVASADLPPLGGAPRSRRAAPTKRAKHKPRSVKAR
jgi:DNA-binding IclR family transcriptional regulator